MVTFTPVGRLGNFLFEAASAMSYAWNYGLQYSIPATTRDAKWHPVYLPHLVNKNFNSKLPEVVVKENGFRYQERAFDPRWDKTHNIRLDGYWQTDKYFRKYRRYLLEAFGYPWQGAGEPFVSVHVRRGDYLTTRKGAMLKHPQVTPEWYKEQMTKFPDCMFAIFSDDIGWCRENFGDGKRLVYSPLLYRFPGLANLSQEEVDLIQMSCCTHHICSASTFSWWSAWLNRSPTKRIIMPKQWINPEWSDIDFSDVLPKEWERA